MTLLKIVLFTLHSYVSIIHFEYGDRKGKDIFSKHRYTEWSQIYLLKTPSFLHQSSKLTLPQIKFVYKVSALGLSTVFHHFIYLLLGWYHIFPIIIALQSAMAPGRVSPLVLICFFKIQDCPGICTNFRILMFHHQKIYFWDFD